MLTLFYTYIYDLRVLHFNNVLKLETERECHDV